MIELKYVDGKNVRIEYREGIRNNANNTAQVARVRSEAPADSLLKTRKKKDIELTEKELDKVSGRSRRH